MVTQSIEVRVTNAGPGIMLSASATISSATTIPIDPLGQVSLGDIPVGFTAIQATTISFSVANESIVKSSPLSFQVTFFDSSGQQRQISEVGKQIP